MARLKWVSTRLFAVVAPLLVPLLICPASYAEETQRTFPLFRFELQVRPIWFTQNELTSPSSSGTTFDVTEGFDTDPAMYGRFFLEVPLADRHELKFWLSPTDFRRSGQFSQPVSFGGATFPANTKIVYRYRVYDLGGLYRYKLLATDSWDLRLGLGVASADVKVTLSQEGGPRETVDEWFVYPLLHLFAGYNITPKWLIFGEAEGVGTSSDDWVVFGQAIVRYRINPLWDVSLGYVGTAYEFETTDLKNSVVAHSAVLSVTYSFWR